MTQCIFNRNEIIDGLYDVKFFLRSDDLSETYRVQTKTDELKFLKVIKPSSVASINLESLKASLKNCSIVDQEHLLKTSNLTSILVEEGVAYYYMQDFVAGETLDSMLKREVYIPTHTACRLVKNIADICGNAEQPFLTFITPDNVYLSYTEGRPIVYLAAFNINNTIKSSTRKVSRSYLAYMDNPDTSNINYSLATLLYRCLFGVLPWQYDIDWYEDKKTVFTQIESHRNQHAISKSSTFTQFIPDELKAIIFDTLNSTHDYRFVEQLNSFIKQYYVFAFSSTQIELTKKTTPYPTSKNLGLSEVAGMDELKSLLQADIIEPLKNKIAYKKYGIRPLNGVLFYGPPGCGKTFIAKQLAYELNHTFFEIKPSDIASTYVHGTQQKIGELFKQAQAKAPSVIFIDEVDAILPSRDSANMNQHYSAEVNEFLSQLTECSEKGILVIMATNRPSVIDNAILRTGRIDKTIYIPLPDVTTRTALLRLLLKNRPTDPLMDLDSIALLLSSYTSSDIKYIVNESAKLALLDESNINAEQLSSVIRKTKSSVDYKQIENFNSFSKMQRF
tara:strand:+ start:7186 stop:8871 length:1686 start_codon:yes stop_codon:yes gene_type:complete